MSEEDEDVEETENFAGYTREFQDQMLRVLYKDSEFMATIGVYLSAEHFDGKVRRWLASTMFQHAKKDGVGPSMDALKIRLERDLRIKRLQEADRPEAEAMLERLPRKVKDRSFVKDEVFKFTKNQMVRSAIMNSLPLLEKLDFDGIDRELGKVLEVNAAGMGGLGHFYVRDVESRIHNRTNFERNGVPTGFKLDTYLRPGGLWPKAIGVVVAGKGSGKSSTLVSISRAAIVDGGKPVLFISLELEERDIADRFDAGFADVSLSDLAEEPDEVRRAIGELGTQFGEFLVIKRFPRATLTVPMLKAYKRQLEARGFEPGLIVVDYADEMIPSIERDDIYEGQGAIFSELSKFAFEENLPVWTAAQLNREGMGKEMADSRHLGGSIRKVQIADLVIVIGQTPKEKKAGIGRVLVNHSRMGPDGFEIPVRMDWGRQRLSDRNA